MERYRIETLVVVGAREPFRVSDHPRLIAPILMDPITKTVLFPYQEQDGWVLPKDSGPKVNFDYWVSVGDYGALAEPIPAEPDHVFYLGPGTTSFAYLPREEARVLLEELLPDGASEETQKLATGS